MKDNNAKWLLTYNKMGQTKLVIVGYAPKNDWPEGKDTKTRAKLYLLERAKEYRTGTLTMWRLSDEHQASRIFSNGERVDTAEIDTSHNTGEYDMYVNQNINSHIQLVNF